MIKVWFDSLGEYLEIEDDYIDRKYPYLSGLENQRKESILRYEQYLFVKYIFPLLMLKESLILDRRIYGAEWVLDEFES